MSFLHTSHAALTRSFGDSRCYRFSGGALTRVTDDHSMVMELVRAGVLTPEGAATHPMRNVITRAVGTDPEVSADILDFPRVAGDLPNSISRQSRCLFQFTPARGGRPAT